MQPQTTSLQNQPHPTILFGGISHPISAEPLVRAMMFQNQKANSYSQPALPANTKAAQKHAGSEKTSSPRVQPNPLTLSTKPVPPNNDNRTAVSNWLATSQTFEEPPRPEPIADPAPRTRHCKEHWLLVSKSLELRIKSREEKSKAPIYSIPGSVYANPGTNNSISNPQSQIKLPESDKHTSPGQLDTAFPFWPSETDPRKQLERERFGSIEPSVFEIKKVLMKHIQQQKKQAQLEAVSFSQSGKAVKATAKQLEAAAAKKADEAVTVRAKAKKLAADAMAKEEQERKKYVEGRAQDIHEDLLQAKPFDIDAVRREFSEKEVQYIKRVVRELGFRKKN